MTSERPVSERASPLGFVSNLPPDPARYEKQLHAIMEIAWAVSSTLHVDTLLPRIMGKVSELMKAERGTFFVVDAQRGELWSKVVQGGAPRDISLRIGDGIAGWVAQSGQCVRLDDAYQDPRFDRSWDEQSGYRTRSLLCVPVLDRELRVVAVIQCLNKQGRSFDLEDEELLRCVSGQCAIALESAFLYESVLQRNQALQEADARLRRANAELEILYDLERQISEAPDLDALLHDVVERACLLLKMETGAILLVSEAGGRLFVRGQSLTAPPTVEARRVREALGRTQVPQHRRSDPGGLGELLVAGAEIRETFTAPLAGVTGPLGVLQLANRQDEGASEDWLLRMTSLFAGQVARAIVVERARHAGEREQRLSLLGHSVGAILHDMRTPMTAIGGYAELMSSEPDAAVRGEYVAKIGRALEHMEGMTQEVLAFARGKRDVLVRKVYMNEFVAAVQEMLVPETRSYGVTLVVDAAFDGTARFDESKLKRVIFNLARNACQAMGEGGTFTWRVRRQDESLVFECADTGPGIPKEMEGKLFESFATHGKASGTGLGLAMAKKIVDAHCGTIECDSIPGHGATFRITLPL
jgi:signal transduction histidine kinase/putative methionine-R-sulfoxide reductase with GAF domain